MSHLGILRWPTSVKAKLSFSRQNFLSQGKTFFLKAKLAFGGHIRIASLTELGTDGHDKLEKFGFPIYRHIEE